MRATSATAAANGSSPLPTPKQRRRWRKVAAPAALLYPQRVMRRLPAAAVGVLAAFALAGCASRKASHDLAGEPAAIPDSLGETVPLDVREFDVVSGEGGFRGVFLKLSRLPTGVTHHSESAPPRIVLDITGPTGAETTPETYPGGDELVTQVQLARQTGKLQVVLDLSGDDVPEYEVLPMADWVLVRIKPSGTRRPWAHRAS
jgi:hypothetical protein